MRREDQEEVGQEEGGSGVVGSGGGGSGDNPFFKSFIKNNLKVALYRYYFF